MKWKLRNYLDRHGLTPHQLALESKLSVNTVYPMARGEAARISLQTMDKTIEALRSLTGERVDIADLLEFDPTSKTSEGGGPARLGFVVQPKGQHER